MSKRGAIRTQLSLGAAVLLALFLPTAGLANGDGGPDVAAAPRGDCTGEGVVGQVVALSGAVSARAPDGSQRSLACDDVVRQCETLVTSAGARAGILSGEVYAEIDTDTRLQVSLGEAAPDHRLLSGGLRVIDTRGEGFAPFRVRTPHAAARGAGSDTEFFVELVRGRPLTRVCNHSRSIEVASSNGGGSVLAAADACVEADDAALRTLAGAEPRISVATPDSCPFDVVVQLLPTDVAAPPIGSAFPGVAPADLFQRSPCDAPGSGCTGRLNQIPREPRTRPRPSRPIGRDNPDFGCGGLPCNVLE